jgi:hypothetical protein
MTFTVSKSRETGNIWYTRLRQEKQIHNTICVGHHYTALLQTTGSKTILKNTLKTSLLFM